MVPLVPRMIAELFNSRKELVLNRVTPFDLYFSSTSVSVSTPNSFNVPLAEILTGSERWTHCER